MDGAITVWVITWRVAWPLLIAGACIVLAAALSHVPTLSSRFPPIRAVAGPLFAPVALILWAGFNWDQPDGAAPTVLTMLFAVCLLTAMGWPFLFRRVSGVGWVVAAGTVGLLYSLVALFVGVMAISNSWL